MVTNDGPVAANTRVNINVTLNCQDQESRITCTTSTARLCIGGPEDFQNSMGGFVEDAATVTNDDCWRDWYIDPNDGTGCDNLAGNDLLRMIPVNNNAEARAVLGSAIDATGFTDLEVHFDAAISTETEEEESISVRACCGSTGPACVGDAANEVGRALNEPDGGTDLWAHRGPFALAAAFDHCDTVWAGFGFTASRPANGEMVHIDNFAVSGMGTVTIPLTDNGNGTYSGSFAACEANPVTVTCDWTTPDGNFSASTDVQFDTP